MLLLSVAFLLLGPVSRHRGACIHVSLPLLVMSLLWSSTVSSVLVLTPASLNLVLLAVLLIIFASLLILVEVVVVRLLLSHLLIASVMSLLVMVGLSRVRRRSFLSVILATWSTRLP